MATLLRTLSRQGRIACNLTRSRVNSVVACQISTSDKKKDLTINTGKSVQDKSEELRELEKSFADRDPTKEKNWVSYGFSYTDPEYDTFMNNLTLFSFVTIGFLMSCFVFAYFPDQRLNDWSQREAYLEIERRQRLGLPLVDPNLIPVDKIVLPSEEELENTDIIL